jgi:hypothetical protein
MVAKNLTEEIGEDVARTIGKNYTDTIAENSHTTIGKDASVKIGGKHGVKATSDSSYASSILTWLGLGFLAVSIAQGFGEMIGAISVGTTRAWEAPDSPRPRAEIEKAGDEYAHAIALLFKFILMAIVMRLAGPASEALIAQLRKSRLGEGFASWVVRNKEALLKNPKLQAPQPKAVQSEKPVETAVTPSQIKPPAPAEPPAPPPAPKPAKPKRLREQYLGRTPGKASKTGGEVQARMRGEGTLRNGGDGIEFRASDGDWHPLKDAIWPTRRMQFLGGTVLV